MFLASNHQVFNKKEKYVDIHIRKFPRSGAETKTPDTKATNKEPPSEQEHDSYFSLSSSSGSLSDKPDNQKNIPHRKKNVVR